MHLGWWKALRNNQCCVKKSSEGVWGDFLGSPVVRILCFPYRGTGSIPSQGTKILHTTQLSSAQSLSRVQVFVTPWTAAHQDSLSITNSRSLLNLMAFKSVMPSNHLILCHPLLLLPSIFPSIRVFSSESVLYIRCQNIGVSASASVLPMNIQDWCPLG